MIFKNKKNKGFTLVELVVVVAILAILSVIGFVSYSGYLVGVRDTNRISNLKAIGDGLKLYGLKYSLPLPDDYVRIESSGELIGYQGYAGKRVLDLISFSEAGVDPKTKEYYTYYVNKSRKNYQLLGYLEDLGNLEQSAFVSTKKASAGDYTDKYTIVSGDKLGILTDKDNNPIQESNLVNDGKIDLSGTNANDLFVMNIENNRKYSFSGSIISDKFKTLSDPGKYAAPKDCPEGFIGVWGDAGFNQPGFCIAKYEMGYEDESGAVWTDYDSEDFNAYKYDSSKKIISAPGRYPVVQLNYNQAKEACESLGKGFHLVTLTEQMSLLRQIEFEGENWSNGIAGEGYLNHNGVSGDETVGGCAEVLDDNYTTGGNTESRDEATKSGPAGNACDNRRQYTLYNGEKIWDIAGNVREIVDKEQSSEENFSTDDHVEWDSISDSNLLKKFGPLIRKNSSNGVGKISHGDGDNSSVIWYGGASWDGSDIGLYTILPDTDEDTVEQNLGFRCAR